MIFLFDVQLTNKYDDDDDDDDDYDFFHSLSDVVNFIYLNFIYILHILLLYVDA